MNTDRKSGHIRAFYLSSGTLRLPQASLRYTSINIDSNAHGNMRRIARVKQMHYYRFVSAVRSWFTWPPPAATRGLNILHGAQNCFSYWIELRPRIARGVHHHPTPSRHGLCTVADCKKQDLAWHETVDCDPWKTRCGCSSSWGGISVGSAFPCKHSLLQSGPTVARFYFDRGGESASTVRRGPQVRFIRHGKHLGCIYRVHDINIFTKNLTRTLSLNLARGSHFSVTAKGLLQWQKWPRCGCVRGWPAKGIWKVIWLSIKQEVLSPLVFVTRTTADVVHWSTTRKKPVVRAKKRFAATAAHGDFCGHRRTLKLAWSYITIFLKIQIELW